MGNIRQNTAALYTLEQLAEGDTAIHGLHPMAKLLGTLFYLVMLISFPRYRLGMLAPFVFYPVLMLSLGEIPFKLVGKRVLVALPFCLFAGLSNALLDRSPMVFVGGVGFSGGVISCLSILLKTLLCVSVVLVLVAVTPMRALTASLRRLHVPGVFVSLFEMTYRYVGCLMEEVSSMSAAYALRGKPQLEMRHMGAFAGQLLLRSYDRAERIYHAMKCRGFGGSMIGETAGKMSARDWFFMLAVSLSSALFRFVDIPALLGGVLC